jgi:hypothetical protein
MALTSFLASAESFAVCAEAKLCVAAALTMMMTANAMQTHEMRAVRRMKVRLCLPYLRDTRLFGDSSALNVLVISLF